MLQVQKWVSPKVCVVAEGETQADLFSQVSSMEEVFGESKCGKCGSEEIRFGTRKAAKGKKEFTYFEMHCNTCRAKLSFGQSEGGVLFPVRYEREQNEDGDTVYKKDANDRLIPKGVRGWVVYNKATGKEE